MQNFGKIKNAFNELLIDGRIKGEKSNREVFKKYLKMIRENEILKTQYMVYANLEDMSESDDFKAFEIAKANLQLLKGFNKSDIIKVNESLVALLGNNVKNLEKPYDAKKQALHENIVKMVFTKENPKTIRTITESMMNIVSYINENDTKLEEPVSEDLIPTSILAQVAIKKFNRKYSNISEEEKKLIKSLVSSDDNTKKCMYEEMVDKCINLIDGKLNGCDLETKDKLLRVKDKILKEKFVSESFVTDISKLIELRQNLND